MTDRHEIILEAMQDTRRELGTPYSDFGRWAVGDPRFHERVKLGRLRDGEAAKALALAVRLFEGQIARLAGRLAQEQRA
ncbi:hypothetical protein [Sphingopyxis sp. L1A2A]|uniref:hypothetical protein n=1 Tax=Sphingopyxis sp. L1A2A TaxID=2502247 RepID=UPI0010F49B1D|nr:hypothetical protein [Sphingopyxis sp. L1A2A]